MPGGFPANLSTAILPHSIFRDSISRARSLFSARSSSFCWRIWELLSLAVPSLALMDCTFSFTDSISPRVERRRSSSFWTASPSFDPRDFAKSLPNMEMKCVVRESSEVEGAEKNDKVSLGLLWILLTAKFVQEAFERVLPLLAFCLQVLFGFGTLLL